MRWGTMGILRMCLAGLSLWLGVKFLFPLCFPFLLGMGLALSAEPLVKLLCTRLRFPRGISAAVGVTVAFGGLTILVLLILAVLVRELGILAGILPDLTRTAQSGISLLRNWSLDMTARTPPSIRPLLEQNLATLFSGGTALLDRTFSWVLGLAGAILSHVPDSALNFFTAVISGFMISARLPRIRNWFKNSFSRERLRPLLESLKKIRLAIGGWVLAQLRLIGVTFVILLLGLLLLRIPNGMLWALGIALVDAVPVLGTGTVLLPWGLICFLQGDRARAVGLLAVYIVICVTRSVLEPKFLGRQLGLDPLVTLFAIYAGYKLWGIGGMIAAPLLAVAVQQILPEKGRK